MFEVGQKLWFVRSEKRSGESREVTVEKVGRVWATLSNRMRCDASGRVDGGQYSSPSIQTRLLQLVNLSACVAAAG